MASKSFISFYEGIDEIPVNQDLHNLELHFNRRRALYSDLGLPEALLSRADILEFGPGSGDNAIYLDSLSPRSLTLVDGSLPSIRSLTQKALEGSLQAASIVHSNIETFECDNFHDVVLCEGLIPGQADPVKVLRAAARHTKPGGVFVFTTACHVSLLSEVMRRSLHPLLCEVARSHQIDSLEFEISFFDKHLSRLRHSSRFTRDWVLDCIVHPWADRFEFNVADGIVALAHDFEFYSSNPRFMSDWRWYKSKTGPCNNMNALASEQFWNTRPVYLSTRSQVTHYSKGVSVRVSKLSNDIYEIHNQLRSKNDFNIELYNVMVEKAMKIAELCKAKHISEAMHGYSRGVGMLLEKKVDADFGEFASFWGRGQSYISMLRKK